MALALVEAGARAVYCIDLPKEPSEEWQKVRDYAAKVSGKEGQGRLEYISGSVTDQVSQFVPERSAAWAEQLGFLGRDVEDWRVHWE